MPQGSNFLFFPDYFPVWTNNVNLYLGFPGTSDPAFPGNVPLLDQLFVMRFVKENIANFGGDPNRVTIMGQSSGAACVGMHVVSPLTQGKMIFCHFFQVDEVSSIFTFSSGFPQNIQVQKHPKKLESSPTTHVTDISFLHILELPDHVGVIYIFDFSPISTIWISFFFNKFGQKVKSPELAA